MNSDEIRESFQLASNQFDMRAARLKRLYALNADNIIISKELDNLQEAGGRIRNFSLPYEQLIAKLPAIQGERILKEMIDKAEMEEFLEKDEKQWKQIESELNEKFPGNQALVFALLEIMKEKAMLY